MIAIYDRNSDNDRLVIGAFLRSVVLHAGVNPEKQIELTRTRKRCQEPKTLIFVRRCSSFPKMAQF